MEARLRVLGGEHPDTWGALVALGRVRLRRQQHAEAEPVLRDALARYEQAASGEWER